MRRVVVFLNGARGLAAVRAVLAAGHGVVLAVVPPAAPAGVADELRGLGLAVETVADVNHADFLAELAGLAPDVLLIAGFSQIFRSPLLAAARLGAVNLHGGRLPEYRGGSPLNWQMIMGEAAAGISAIRVDAGIDSGPLLAETRIPIGDDDTIATLHDKANAAFPGLALAAIAALERGETGTPQDAARAAYWHQRADADGRLAPARTTAAEALRFIRALTRPYPGAWLEVAGRIVRVFAARHAAPQVRGTPGRIVRVGGEGPFLICRDGALLLTDWAAEDGGPLPSGVFAADGPGLPARREDGDA